MSRRTIVLLVALLLAVLAAFAVWRYLSTVEDNVRADLEEVIVYRANTLIEPGTAGTEAIELITPGVALVEDVVFEGSTIFCEGPVDRDAPGVDLTVCDNNPRDVQTALATGFAAGPISAGQLITSDLFVQAAELEADKLSTEIPDGKVAIAINPGPIGSVGGQVVPGDHVNLVATFELDISTVKALLADPDTREFLLDTSSLPAFLTSAVQPTVTPEEGEEAPAEEPVDPLAKYAEALPDQVVFTQTILQDLPVLAIGDATVTSPAAAEDGPLQVEPAVVLEVLPNQAELVELARQRAALSLVLVPATYSEVEAPGATVDDVFRFIERLREQLEGLDGS